MNSLSTPHILQYYYIVSTLLRFYSCLSIYVEAHRRDTRVYKKKHRRNDNDVSFLLIGEFFARNHARLDKQEAAYVPGHNVNRKLPYIQYIPWTLLRSGFAIINSFVALTTARGEKRE